MAGLTVLTVGSVTQAILPSSHDTTSPARAEAGRAYPQIRKDESAAARAKEADLLDALNGDELRSQEERPAAAVAENLIKNAIRTP